MEKTVTLCLLFNILIQYNFIINSQYKNQIMLPQGYINPNYWIEEIPYIKPTLEVKVKDLGIQIKTFSSAGHVLHVSQQFKLSDYGFENKRILDEEKRKSQFSFCQIEGILQSTNQFLKSYLNGQPQVIKHWRILKYENGHFDWHEDHQKQRNDLQHIGTQILLPPQNQCAYNGGELEIKQKGIQVQVKPDPVQWTHIIIPLGIEHRVKKVQGIRISFTKEIFYGKKEKKVAKKYTQKKSMVPQFVD